MERTNVLIYLYGEHYCSKRCAVESAKNKFEILKTYRIPPPPSEVFSILDTDGSGDVEYKDESQTIYIYIYIYIFGFDYNFPNCNFRKTLDLIEKTLPEDEIQGLLSFKVLLKLYLVKS